MHQNRIWIGFLTLLIGLTVWFGVKAASQLTRYYGLSEQISATVEKWEIKAGKGDRYRLKATYFFESPQGERIVGSGCVGGVYKNPWSAERALERARQQSWEVWHDQKHPNRSALEKNFPYRSTLSALIVAGLSLYFIGLGFYLGASHGRRN